MQSNCRIMVPRFYTFEGLGQNTQIENIADRIMHKKLHLRNLLDDGSIEFEMINIIPHARYRDGILYFRLNYAMIPYAVEVNRNFTEFQLKYVLQMATSYAVKLYKLLYQYKNIKSRTFLIDDLKKQFGLDSKYPEYKNFKQKVLNPSLLHINNETDLNVELIEIKLGRKVDRLEFKFSLKDKTNQRLPEKNDKILQINDNVDCKNIINNTLDRHINEISENTYNTIINSYNTYGEIFVIASINYAKKNSKANFDKYLLETLNNKWAELEVKKINIKKAELSQKAKQKTETEEKLKHNKLLENANKSEIEHLFMRLSLCEQNKFEDMAIQIFKRHEHKLIKLNTSANSIKYSIFAVSNDRFYNKTLEKFITAVLNTQIDIR